MKKAIFFLCVLLATSGLAQDKRLDSLYNVLKTSKHDTTTIGTYIAIGEKIYLQYPDSALVLWQKASALAEKNVKKYQANKTVVKVCKKQLVNALNNISYIYLIQGDAIKKMEYNRRCLKISEEIGYKEGVATSLNSIGRYYLSQGDNTKALACYHRSLKISKKMSDKEGVAITLANIGHLYQQLGDIAKALENYYESLKISEEIGYKEGIAYSLATIGGIYKQLGDIPKALENYKKSLKIFEEMGDEINVASCCSSISDMYLKHGDINQAVGYCERSLKISEKIGYKLEISSSLQLMGKIYNKQGNIPKALEYLGKSLIVAEEINNKRLVSYSLCLMSDSYLKLQKHNKAKELLIRSLKLAQEIGEAEQIQYVTKRLTDIYQATGNYQKAFESYELYIQMRDSMNNEDTKKASIKSQLKYEYEKQAAVDSIANAKQIEVKNAELKTKRNQQYALYGGLLLVLVFAGFMFNRFKVTQKQKTIIEEQKHLVEEKHQEITDSINYAERIQRSFLATQEMLDKNLKDYFVFFKPKDVVSGDFYWAAELGKDDFLFTAADSTGHGVPGAIMSLLNITSLEKAIEKHQEPHLILNETRKIIINRLKNDGSSEGGKDGMDCSLLHINKEKMQMTFAASNNPVFVIRNNELTEYKGDKMPVGKHEKEEESFSLHTLQLQTGDVIYTLTDGFPDQFGGEKGKKYMIKNLKQLFVSIATLPMQEQEEKLNAEFIQWKGELEQVDDVCVIGIRI